MKKKLTFPLLVLVLLLWGAIFYRVFSGLGADTDVTPTPKAVVPSRPAADVTDDTLLLNYRDPFLSNVQEAPVMEEDTLVADYGYVEEAAPYVDWSQVQYLGSVNNRGNGKSVALVRINGREYMLTSGETVDGFTLVKQNGLSISMSYSGQVTTVAMQPGNNEMQYQ